MGLEIETVAELLGRRGRLVFSERQGMPAAASWIENNQEYFNHTILPSFARVVRRLNNMLDSGNVPSDCINIIRLRETGIKLPSLSILIEHFGANQGSFDQILTEVNYRMIKGEAGDKADGKFFTFHTWISSNDPEALVAAAIIDISELLFWEMRGGEPENTGIISNVLIEALAEEGEANPLYAPLIAQNRANFVYGYDGFSKGFRNRVVGEPISS